MYEYVHNKLMINSKYSNFQSYRQPGSFDVFLYSLMNKKFRIPLLSLMRLVKLN